MSFRLTTKIFISVEKISLIDEDQIVEFSDFVKLALRCLNSIGLNPFRNEKKKFYVKIHSCVVIFNLTAVHVMIWSGIALNLRDYENVTR